MNREDMVTQLRENACRVIFTKVNGEERDMVCTLQTDQIPEAMQPKSDAKYNDEVIRAFDVNKQEWRSFKVANVLSFTCDK